MKNRTLTRPMFRMGGSTGTGITSGLDQPRKQYNVAGRVTQGLEPYVTDTLETYKKFGAMPDQSVLGSGTIPGFLQTALGAAATGAGIYGALRRP